jgi:hypothetical protein
MQKEDDLDLEKKERASLGCSDYPTDADLPPATYWMAMRVHVQHMHGKELHWNAQPHHHAGSWW